MENQKFKDNVLNLIKTALNEDGEDATTLSIFTDKDIASAKMLCKDNCVLAGLDAALEVFRYLDADIKIKTMNQQLLLNGLSKITHSLSKIKKQTGPGAFTPGPVCWSRLKVCQI